MKSLPIIYIVFITLFLAFAAFAGVDVAELVKNHPVQADFPNDESVILYEGINYTLTDDGRVTKTVHRVRTLFNENSLDHHGDIFVNFYEAKQDLNIEICRSYMLDGKAVDTWDNGFNQITPFALDRAPDYTGFQETVCTHTGLEWGGTTELKYSIIDKQKISDWMEGIEYFQTDEYIMHKTVSVTVPETVDLHFKFLNGDGNVKQKVIDGKITWSWEVMNMPHILHDDAYNYRLRFAPALVFSTCHDWKYAGEYYAKNIKSWMGDYEPVKKAAESATGGLIDEMDVVSALAEYVRDNVRTVNYHLGMFPWFPRTAEKALTSRYGSEFNKAILLGALLRAQGFKSYVAVSSDRMVKELDIPALSIFDSFWVVVQANGKKLFIDPTRSLSDRSYKDVAGQLVFVFDFEGNTPAVTDNFDLNSNNIVLNLNVKVESDGSYTGSGYFEAGGIFSPYYEIFTGGADEWVKDHFDGIMPNLISENGKARKLNDCCVELIFNFKGENLGDTEEGFIKLNIPQSPVDISKLYPSGFHGNYSAHKNPVFMKGVGSLMVNFAFELPDGWSVAYNPPNMNVETENIAAFMDSKLNGKKYNFKAKYGILKNTFDPGDFKDLRTLYLMNENGKSNIVFKTE